MNDMFSADELEACLKVRLALRYIYTCRAGANKTKKNGSHPFLTHVLVFRTMLCATCEPTEQRR